MRGAWVLLGVSSLLAGCSLLAPGDDEYLGGSSTGGAAGASSGGTSGASSGGTSSGGTSSGGTGGTGGTCTKQQGTLAPRSVELYVVLHRTVSISPSQWGALRNQVSQFFGASGSAGLSAGLQYLPPLSGAGACDGTGFGAPDVPFGLLPGNATALQQSLSNLSQTSGALFEGAANGFKAVGLARTALEPTRQFSVALITIGSWYGCTGTAAAVAPIIASAWPTVSTYVIPAGAAVDVDCDAMALAGGTVSKLGSGATGGVGDALSQAARPCQFALPGGVSATNVDLTLSVASPIPLQYRAAASQCGTDNGWFVSPSSSQTAVLCPVSCRNAIAVTNASVEYVTSCP